MAGGDDVVGWAVLGVVLVGAAAFIVSNPQLLSQLTMMLFPTPGGTGGRGVGGHVTDGMGMMMMMMMGTSMPCLAALSPGRTSVNLAGTTPVFSTAGVMERIAGSPNAVSAGLLQLNGGANRGYIVHPSADKMIYCSVGTGLVTLYALSMPAAAQVFTMMKGDVAFIPRGFAHNIKNTGKSVTSFVEGWNASTVQTMQATMPRVTPKVASGLKVNLDTATPNSSSPGGSDTAGNSDRLHTLRGLSLNSIILKPAGVREPHKHPNASELHFVLSGQMGYQVQDPSGVTTDMGNLGPGSFFVAPQAYWHWFWNTGGNNDLRVIAVFTNELPGDVGWYTGYQVISKRALAGCPTIADYMK
jgi:oxalate decarboxylase